MQTIRRAAAAVSARILANDVYALNLLRGVLVNATFPPDPSKGVPN